MNRLILTTVLSAVSFGACAQPQGGTPEPTATATSKHPREVGGEDKYMTADKRCVLVRFSALWDPTADPGFRDQMSPAMADVNVTDEILGGFRMAATMKSAADIVGNASWAKDEKLFERAHKALLPYKLHLVKLQVETPVECKFDDR